MGAAAVFFGWLPDGIAGLMERLGWSDCVWSVQIGVAVVMNPMAKARGLQRGRVARRVRPHTGDPADILRSDGVGRPSEAAPDATKLRLRSWPSTHVRRQDRYGSRDQRTPREHRPTEPYIR